MTAEQALYHLSYRPSTARFYQRPHTGLSTATAEEIDLDEAAGDPRDYPEETSASSLHGTTGASTHRFSSR